MSVCRLFATFLLSVAAFPAHAAAPPACVASVLDSTLSPAEPVLNSLHVRRTPRGFDVLTPMPDGTLHVQTATSLPAARALLGTIKKPISIATLLERSAHAQEEVTPILNGVASRHSGVRFAVRIKDGAKLKDKLFDRTLSRIRHGQAYRLSDMDDLTGARLICPGREELLAVTRSIRGHPEFIVAKDELVHYSRGYRANHLTVRTKSGHLVEIQIMTERMQRWSDWNHDRIYKPGISSESPYFKKLQQYDRAIITRLNALDDRTVPLPPVPDPKTLDIRPEDVFPDHFLR